MRCVWCCPPGDGKGTQAERMVDRFGGGHIATGDILRSNVERGTELGRTASGYMDRGDLVPDDVIVDMVLERLGEGGGGGGVGGDGGRVPPPPLGREGPGAAGGGGRRGGFRSARFPAPPPPGRGAGGAPGKARPAA